MYLVQSPFVIRGCLRLNRSFKRFSSSSVTHEQRRGPEEINPEDFELLNRDQFRVDTRKTSGGVQKRVGRRSQASSTDQGSREASNEALLSDEVSLGSREEKQSLKQSLYSYVEGFSGTRYSDRTHRAFVFDRQVAKRIAQLVSKHSRRQRLSLVTEELLKMGVVRRVKILERDEKVLPLVQHLKEAKFDQYKGADVTVVHQNYLQHCSTTIHHLNYLLVPPLVDVSETIDHEKVWHDGSVPFTMLATVTHTTLKYLISRCLRRSNPLSEFYMGRSELFLILSPHCFARVRRDSKHSRLFSDIMFHLLFDLEPLEEVPGEGFFPQLTNFGLNFKQCPTDRAVLVRVQPKVDLGLRMGASLDDFNYFVHSLQHRKVDRLVLKLERWLPGMGVEAIKCGHSIFTQGGQVALEEFVQLFNHVVAHEGFQHSTLPVQSKLFKSGMDKTAPIRQEGSHNEKMLDELRKTYI